MNKQKLRGEKTMEKNCIDCGKSVVFEDGVIECEAEKYDIHAKSCFVPKICKVEKNQRLVNHIMEFDAQGKEYDWYEQHIAMIADGKRQEDER